MALTDADVREILRIIDEAQLDELRLEQPGLSLYVARNGASAGPPAAPPAAPTPPNEPAAAASPAPTPPPEPEGQAAAADGLPAIEAPMLGTFYRADGPGRTPFVEVGTRVEPDTVVAIIEVMKMMNSIQAGVAGTIEEVCVANAELVEIGQPLFRVRPA